MSDQIGEAYLSGQAVWGDDFSPSQIAAWFEDEREGYADLGAAELGSAETYGHHEQNRITAFRHLPAGALGDALGIGSSYGGEFLPIIDRLASLTILEPSLALRSHALAGRPVTYESPQPDGIMPFDDGRFDLVMSLGTLHHIPNVTRVVREIGRVTRPDGYVVIREPIRSMGDWTKLRPGLTKRERGIPRRLLRQACQNAGLTVVKESLCEFPTTRRLGRYRLGFNTGVGVRLDLLLSALTARNDHYHATKSWHKVAPTVTCLVLQKQRVA